MDLKDYLTNEKIAKKFKSQFDLVSYAIRLADNMIKTGRDCRVKTDIQNRSLQVLAEILNNKDQFDEIIEEKPIKEEERYESHAPRNSLGPESSKSSERKKVRRVFLDDTLNNENFTASHKSR